MLPEKVCISVSYDTSENYIMGEGGERDKEREHTIDFKLYFFDTRMIVRGALIARNEKNNTL